MEEYRLKNYYALETLDREILRFPAVAFDLYETLLLWDVLSPADLMLQLEEEMRERFDIFGFTELRRREEQEARVRLADSREDICLTDIYEGIAARTGKPAQELMRIELRAVRAHTTPNPFMKTLYDHAARAGKRIVLTASAPYPADFLARTARDCGYLGFEAVFSTGESALSKESGNFYRLILDSTDIPAGQLFFIGQNHPETLRRAGLAGYFYRPLRERWEDDRRRYRERKINAGEAPVPEKPVPHTLERSMRRAATINRFYTRILHPSKEVIVRVRDVSMMFNMSSERIDNIKEFCIKLIKKQLMFQEFWALEDVSFEVRRGERVGLIGLNGSGKSTMLKVVSGVLAPTKGSVEVLGAIAPLIELGAGFDFDLSARENVFLNGAILGYSRKEMEKRYREIMDFAQLWEFENVPIKNFSSGMIARLGFAVATCHTPDVLIIDEILSVGDFEFQKKCHAKMQELTGKGTTVLFVSHSAGDIVEMCDRAVWLERGRVTDMGEAEYIVGRYLNQ